jgi:DNA-binding CsgD family transcriptional regulator/PAS domain-containing protein
MDDPISAERLSYLIGLVYDCASDPIRWPIALEAIRVELDFHNATLDLIQLPSGEVLGHVRCNVPLRYAALMDGAGPDVIEQWGGEQVMRTLPMDEPAVLTRANPAFDFETSTNPYVLAFAKPQDIVDVMAIGLARDARGIGSVAFGRHRSAGPIGERETAIARLLVPHLQRAATINRMLEGAALARAAFAATLDALTTPILLVDGELRLLHANPAAERLIQSGALLRIDKGMLAATTLGASSALAAAVRQAARDESAIGRQGLGIPVSGRDGESGALHVLPLRRRQGRNDQREVAAVFVARVDQPFVAPTEMAAALFNLTPTEARVFEHLVTGFTQARTAAALGIERSTVKTHLARLYDKIGVRRQADLVRVAASLAAPV